MISFHSENGFELKDHSVLKAWITKTIQSEKKNVGEINYIFCDDEYLLKINVDFLDHDTYTDIISFDYTQGDVVSGDIYISTERVAENATTYNTTFQTELKRVMIHGILHYCGYGDKTSDQKNIMRAKEDYYLLLTDKGE